MRSRRFCFFLSFIMIFGTVLMLFGCSDDTLEEVPISRETEVTSDEENPNNEAAEDSDKDTVLVYVCGAVNSPGVYSLEASARLFQAVEAAGGMREDACQDAMNLARPLVDGEQIKVPTIEEAKAGEAGTEPGADPTSEPGSGKININTAGESELTSLTGIGRVKAGSIIEYRSSHGGFSSIEDLMKVDGIGEGTFDKIKDKITI